MTMHLEDLKLLVKKIIHGKTEKYQFGNKNLLFKTGSRPVRRRYIDSPSDVVRNDVLQINFIEKNFRPNDVLWDIGSHHGHYSIFAAVMANGEAQVFSFEPDAAARQVQMQNITFNHLEGKIKVSNAAVSNAVGVLSFLQMNGNSNSHILSKHETKHGDIVDVESVTLNYLFEKLPKPTFVKIDTEGAEINILSAADQLLADPKINFVCELHPFAWDNYGVNYGEFESIIRRFGRQIRVLDEHRNISQLPYYGTVIF